MTVGARTTHAHTHSRAHTHTYAHAHAHAHIPTRTHAQTHRHTHTHLPTDPPTHTHTPKRKPREIIFAFSPPLCALPALLMALAGSVKIPTNAFTTLSAATAKARAIPLPRLLEVIRISMSYRAYLLVDIYRDRCLVFNMPRSVCVCVCVCACVYACMCVYVCMCKCVCVRPRPRQKRGRFRSRGCLR